MTTTVLTDHGLGLEVARGVGDLVRAAPGLKDQLHEHGVLVIREAGLDNRSYLEFCRAFGRLETVFPIAHQDPGFPEIRLQSNLAGVGVAGGGEYWHADGPLTETPTALTFLLCEAAPDAGGETLFADMRRALTLLDPATRQRVRGLNGWYACRQIALREMADAGIPQREQEEKLATLRDLTHPLVRRHPVTGREALYLNQQWLAGVEGVDDGDQLLAELYAAATVESNVYRHRWAPGDLLVWDNAAVMHRASPPLGGAKTTRRVTVSGAGYA